MSDPNRTEKMDRTTLVNLFNADMAATSRATAERNSIATKIKGLKESHGLNTDAYRVAKNIAKKPNGDREQFVRVLAFYLELLDVYKQRDFLDDIQASGKPRTPQEEELDAMHTRPPVASGESDEGGESEGGETESQADRPDAGRIGSALRPNTAAGKRAIGSFITALKDAGTEDAVNTGLDRFTTDNPYLADDARRAAVARLDEIAKEAGGGADLRPTALREAAKTEAEQIAKDAKATARAGKRNTKGGASAAAVH